MSRIKNILSSEDIHLKTSNSFVHESRTRDSEILPRKLPSFKNLLKSACVLNLESRARKNLNPSNFEKNLMEKMFESHSIMFKHHFLIVCSASQKCEFKINVIDNIINQMLLFLALLIEEVLIEISIQPIKVLKSHSQDAGISTVETYLEIEILNPRLTSCHHKYSD